MDTLWIILSDFDSVISLEEKYNGVEVTAYKTRDITEYFLLTGLVDMTLWFVSTLAQIASFGASFIWRDSLTWPLWVVSTLAQTIMVDSLWMQVDIYGKLICSVSIRSLTNSSDLVSTRGP